MKHFVELTEAVVATVVQKLHEFHGCYADQFRTKTRSAAEPVNSGQKWALPYFW